MEPTHRLSTLPSADQTAVINLYTNKNLGTEIKREILFLSQNKELSIKVATISVSKILSYTFAGAATGGILGKIFGGPLAMVTGIKVGSALGLSAGIVISTTQTVIMINKSEDYARWKTEAIKNEVYPIFRDYLINNHDLDGYLCHFTQELIMVPVKSPNGHVYEKAHIEAWIDQQNEFIRKAEASGASLQKLTELRSTICPNRGSPFGKEDLVYDGDYVNRICKVATEILQKIKNENDEKAQIIKEGFKAAKKNLAQNNTALLVETNAKLTQDLADAEADDQTYSKVLLANYRNFKLKSN